MNNGGMTVGSQTIKHKAKMIWESQGTVEHKAKRKSRSSRAQGRGGMRERSRAQAFIVPGELTWAGAMKAEVTASWCMYLAWYAQPGSRKAALSFLGVPNALPLIHDECGSFRQKA
jgi:hypothetical protein